MPGWFDITHLDSAGLAQMMKGRPFDPEGTKARVPCRLRQSNGVAVQSPEPWCSASGKTA